MQTAVPRRGWPPEVLQEVIQKFTSGVPTPTIMAEYGITEGKLRCAMSRLDVKRPEWYLSKVRGEAKRGKFKKVKRDAETFGV